MTVYLFYYLHQSDNVFTNDHLSIHFGLSAVAAHSDYFIFCAVYKYSYLLTFLLMYFPANGKGWWQGLLTTD